MTKKAKSNRFDYATQEALQNAQAPVVVSPSPSTPLNTNALVSPVLTTVARRSGRMEQDREQLNVRLPTQLKRRALAVAAMEGLTVGELIEQLLLAHLEKTT